MRRILDMVLAIREYVVFALCILCSFLLLSFDTSPQIRALRGIAIVSLGFVQDAADIIPNYFNLRDENRVLREKNLVLSEELSRLREAVTENNRLRQMLGLRSRSASTYVAANVVGKNLQLFSSSITLDIGTEDGIRVDMPMVTHNGLAGRIIACGSHYAVAQTLFHREMRTSAMVERSRVDGILRWNGERYLTLENVAKTLDVQMGDRVMTSEYSSIFPAGITIGHVIQTSEETGNLFQTIRVAPEADLLRLEEVFVLFHSPDTTRTRLEQQALK